MAKREQNPDEIVHLQVQPGGTAIYQDRAYGDRATLQVCRGDVDQVEGPVEEIDPNEVPDVGEPGGLRASP